jgi:hypothetical protein
LAPARAFSRRATALPRSGNFRSQKGEMVGVTRIELVTLRV